MQLPDDTIRCCKCGADSGDDAISSCERCTDPYCVMHLRKCITCGQEMCDDCANWRTETDTPVYQGRGRYETSRQGVCRDCDEYDATQPAVERARESWTEAATQVAAALILILWVWVLYAAWEALS